jgi:fructan beta-fructosidase
MKEIIKIMLKPKLIASIFMVLITLNVGVLEAKDFKFKKNLKVTAKNMLLPVVFPDKSLSKKERADLYEQVRLKVFMDAGKTLVHSQIFDYPRDFKSVTYWGYLDMSEFVGQEATLVCDRPGRDALFEKVKFSDEQGEYVVPLYTEKVRPQYHFTPKQGWNNDPNGLYYLDGLYHMSFQNGALNRGWGNIYWGHAVSKDLLHWEESNEWPRVLRSNGGAASQRHPSMAVGQCYSGGAVVDENNRLGLQKTNGPKTVIIAYTDANGRGECLAYSNDGGKRFTSMEDSNPAMVLPNEHGGPSKKSWGRDPKPFWHEPTQRWVIVTYLMGQTPAMCSGHMTFYTSTDMKHWEFASKTEKLYPENFPKINGKVDPAYRDWKQKDFHECPDFFQLAVDGDEKNKKWVLIGGGMLYQIGSFDGKTFTPDEKVYHRGLFGDMKAGQAFSNVPGGRVVYVLWSRLRRLQQPGQPLPPFVQGITLPVEMKLNRTSHGLRLSYHPIEEMATIRGRELTSMKDQTIKDSQDLSFSPTLDTIEVEIQGRSSTEVKVMTVSFGEGNALNIDLAQHRINGYDVADCPKAGQPFSFRFFIDRAQWNVFINEGRTYHHHARHDSGQALKNFKISTSNRGGTLFIEKLTVHEVLSTLKK